ESTRGISWLGQLCHAKADCTVILDTHATDSTLVFGWLAGTFNPTGCKCSPLILSDPRPKRVRVSICNSTCLPERGRRCHRYECFAGMNTRQVERAIMANNPKLYGRIDRIISEVKSDLSYATGNLELYIKPCLECSVNKRARLKLNEYIGNQFPGIPLVDNPFYGQCEPGYICERHGNVKGNANTIIDLDGVSYSKINHFEFWNSNRNALMVLAWKPCHNGIVPGPFISPLARSKFCTLRDMRSIKQAISQ
ncbi:MAG: hypothetical protein ACK528_09545, partial [Alphaproteobacteria bacterium]